MSDELLSCPFCKEPRFDLIGLKTHLQNHCDEYGKYESVLCIATRPTEGLATVSVEGLVEVGFLEMLRGEADIIERIAPKVSTPYGEGIQATYPLCAELMRKAADLIERNSEVLKYLSRPTPAVSATVAEGLVKARKHAAYLESCLRRSPRVDHAVVAKAVIQDLIGALSPPTEGK